MAWGAKAGVGDWTRKLIDNDAGMSSLLVLRNRRMVESDWVELCQALHGNTALSELKASGHALGASAAAAFGAMLAQNTGLRRLAVGDEAFGDAGLAALAAGLGANAVLQELELDLKGGGADGARALAGALKDNGALQRLTLARNALGDAGVVALCEALAAAPASALAELDLSETEMGDAGAAALADLLAAPRCALRRLTLARNTLTERGCAALWRAVQGAGAGGRGLSALTLDGCPGAFGGAAVEAMRGALALPGGALRQLSLQGVECAEEQRPAAAAALGGCPVLRKLALNGAALGDRGMEALAAGLRACAEAGADMESLDVSENGATAAGAAALLLCAALPARHVSLFGNSVGSEGGGAALAAELRAAAEACAADVAGRLSDLDLGGNGLDEEGALALLAALRDCPNLFPRLATLGLGGNEGLNDKEEPSGALAALLAALLERAVPLEVVYRMSMKPDM